MTDLVDVKSPYFTNLFEPGRQDRSIQEYDLVRVAPDCSEAPASIDAAPNLTFQIQDKDGIYLPSEAYLELQVQLNNGATPPVALTTVKHALINGWSLFRYAQFRIDSRIVEEKNESGLGALIRALVDYTPDYAQSLATASHFYKDTGDGGDGRAITSVAYLPLNTYNDGFFKRNAICNGNNAFTITIPMRDIFGYLKHTSKISYGNTLVFDLQRQTDYKRIIHNTGAEEGVVQLTKAVMWIPKIRPDDLTKGELEAQLASGLTTIVPFYDWKMYDYSIPNTSSDVNWDIGSLPSKPVRVVVALQNKIRRTLYTNNPGLFDNAGCTRIWIEVNNRKYPMRDYTPNFANDDYGREFMAYLSASNKCFSGNCEVGSLVDYKDFKDLYTLYCFDTSARDASMYDSTTSWNVVVRATIDPAANYHIYCMVDTEKQLKLKGAQKKLEMML